MKIRALRTIRTDVGNVRRGEITDKLSDPAAKSLIKRGLAELVDDQVKPEPKAEADPQPEGKAAAKPKTPAKPKGAKSSPETGAKAPEGD